MTKNQIFTSYILWFRVFTIILLVNFHIRGATAADVTWIGGNGKWSQGSNWDSGMEPEAGDNVFIGANDTVLLNTVSNAINFIGIENNALLTIEVGATLHVSNFLGVLPMGFLGAIGVKGSIVNDGQITLDSVSFDHGLYVRNIGDLRNNGTIIISGILSSAPLNLNALRLVGMMENFGSVNIDGKHSGSVLNVTGTLLNYHIIDIQEGSTGLRCSGFSRNEAGGTIDIRNCTNGCWNGGNFINDNFMSIDNSSVNGFQNIGTFENNGILTITSAIATSFIQVGLTAPHSFNTGLIQIEPGARGIHLDRGVFTNDALGEIQILGPATDYALEISPPATFTNDGILDIDLTP